MHPTSSKTKLTLGLAILLLAAIPPADAETYSPNWESLGRHTPAPEWFRDAKFGIYFHWGVYCVPAYANEWYPREMHQVESKVHAEHVKRYGDPAEYGYDRFVPEFTTERFDADEWCDLFASAGARFVGPVAEHHDGFAMWDSEWTPWNAADRGPKRDITGEMAVAARDRDLKFVTTFHHARNNLWQKPNGDGSTHWTGHYDGAKTDFPSVLNDPQRAILYGYLPRERFLETWNGKLEEVIDKYSPDLIWFDSWLDEIPDSNLQRFAAYYLNHADDEGKEVVITYKQKDFPQTVGVLDIEKGGQDQITDFAWLTDDTISLGSWCYTESLKVKSTNVVLHSLVDIVSKNGQLLLNVSPQSDGTIPEDQRQVLLGLGAWLDRFGEAIYGTRPYLIHGHGPTKPGEGHFGGQATDIAYTASDVRYTRKGDVVYAIVLGWPGAGEPTLLEGFSDAIVSGTSDVTSVVCLGSDNAIRYKQGVGGLTVHAPDTPIDNLAIVYKITTTPGTGPAAGE